MKTVLAQPVNVHGDASKGAVYFTYPLAKQVLGETFATQWFVDGKHGSRGAAWAMADGHREVWGTTKRGWLQRLQTARIQHTKKKQSGSVVPLYCESVLLQEDDG